jgi:DNA-binding LytR/AlgR family response regulator
MTCDSSQYKIMFKSATGHFFYTLYESLFIQADDKYAKMTMTGGREKVCVFHSLKEIEEKLTCGRYIGPMIFFRTHRQYITAMHHAQCWKENNLIILESDHEIPVGKAYRKPIIEKLSAAYS